MDLNVDIDVTEFLARCLPAWEKFLDIYNSVDTLESFGRADIKNYFKVANDLETMLSADEGYISLLAAELEKKGETSQELGVDKGKKACDVLLTKFLLAQGKNTNCREWAVDEYVDVRGKDSLHSLIESLLRVEMSYKVVLQYVKQRATSDPSSRFASMLGLRILAAQLKKLMQNGDIEGISMIIAILLNDQTDSHKVLNLLLLQDDTTWNQVTPVILDTVLRSMKLGERKSSSFWQVLATTDEAVIARVCQYFPVFLEALLSLVVWSGNRLLYEYCQQTRSHKWVAPKDDAHALHYQQLVGLVRPLLGAGGSVREQTLSRLEAQKAEGGSAVWDKVFEAANMSTNCHYSCS